jgi:hypothetical protein
MSGASPYREIMFASVGLILSSGRLAKGMNLELDRKELTDFGSCLQALCEQGINFDYSSNPKENSMFPRHPYSPGRCIEGVYLALKIERKHLQDRNSPLFERLNCLRITSLDTLAQALQASDDNSEKYQAIQALFEKWHALAEEMVAVSSGRLEFCEVPKAIREALKRFPSRH